MKKLALLFAAALALALSLQAQTANYPDIQNNSYGSGWQECDVGCAGGINPPTFTQFLQNSNEHTLDGKSTKMTVSGPDTDVLWYNKVGANNSANTVVWDHWVYFDVNSYIWAFEFDMFQFVAHYNYMMGTECSFGGGFWQLYDEANTQWVNTAIPCTRTGFAPNTWHHLVLVGYTNTTTHAYTFISLQIDGTDHPLGVTYNARNMGGGWTDDSGAQYQADTMSGAGTVNMWIDKSDLSFSYIPLSQPPVPVLPVGCDTADATCVPRLAGQGPMMTSRYIPVVAALGSFDPSTQCGMPGVRYTYPSTADTRHVWCPLTATSARSLMNLDTIGGETLHPGDSIFFQKQSSGTTYSFDGHMYAGHTCETALIFQGTSSDCNLAIPGLSNPSKEITYMGTTGFANLPLSGDRIVDADEPNFARFLFNINGGASGTLDVLPYANYWYMEGIEMASNNTIGATYYQAGEQVFLLQMAAGADTGQRDLIATTGGLVEILGQAISVSSEGGVLVGTDKQSCALGATCNITIIGQDTHMCDNVAVSCASMGADSPTFGTLGYGVIFNSIVITNVACPSSPYTMTGTCQQAVLNITVSSSAIIPAVQGSGNNASVGSAPTRPLILRTPRHSTNHRDEYLINNAALDITDSTIPTIIQVINTTLSNRPILPLPAGSNTSSAPQSLRILTQNAHMLGKGIGTAQFTLGGGGANTGRINVISANVINDNELDVVITVQHNFNFVEPVWLAILGGGTSGAPVPIISGYAENLVYQIPTAQTNSWIQSNDCPQVVPGETYTCHIVGSPNTNWMAAPPTFTSPANVQPDGTLDLRITSQSIQDAHHATITFTVDGSYPPVPNHITFDHVHVHGIEPGIRKDANGLYTPLPLAMQGPIKAQAVGIPVEIEGSMNAFINSRCTGAMWPDGESHCIYSQLGPGPLLFRNNGAEGAEENLFFSGSWQFSQASPQAFPMDYAVIQNHSYQLESNNGNAAIQRLQPATGTQTTAVNHTLANIPFTNFVVTVAGGSITGVTGGRTSDGLNTGFFECPDGIFMAGNGKLSCSVNGTGALVFHVDNPGSGYSSPPNLTLYYAGPMLVKNCGESKGNIRLLWYGNVCENFMPNSGLNQVGAGVTLSSKDVGSGSQLAVLQDITIKDNYGLKNFVPLSFFANIFCYQSINTWLYSSKAGCSPAWDYKGTYPNPLTVGGTAAGNPGGYGSNMVWINNLFTTSDIADYNGVGGAGGGLFPNPAIWNPLTHDLQFTPNAMVHMAFIHNTIWKRSGWSSGPESSIKSGSSGLSSNPFTYSTPFSIQYDGWFLNNAMMGSPSADGAPADILRRVSNMEGCPNGSGPACPASGAANWPARFTGNFFYNATLTNTPATGDFTFGGLASNVSFPATSVGTIAGQPIFANSMAQVEGVQSGNWQITGPPPGGTLPTTTDGGPVGVDNDELQNAIAHVWTGVYSNTSLSDTTLFGVTAIGVTIK